MTAVRLLVFLLAASLGTALMRLLPARHAHRAADPRLARLLRGVPAAALGALLVTSVGSALPEVISLRRMWPSLSPPCSAGDRAACSGLSSEP